MPAAQESPSLPPVNLGVSFIVYGASKAGKSFLGDTTPAPRLVLDAESGSRFTPSQKVNWDPSRQEPPTGDKLDTVLVTVHDFAMVARCLEWLRSGQHPFKSVVLDSISEIQQRCVDSISGTNIMQVQDWGTLLRQVSDVVRQFRDLTTSPVKPLEAVMFIAMETEREGKTRPLVQGRLADYLPYYVDVLGYLFTQREEATQKMYRRLLVSPHERILAGERVGGRLGEVVDRPDITKMLAAVAGKNVEA